jgi:hypothetical protein
MDAWESVRCELGPCDGCDDVRRLSARIQGMSLQSAAACDPPHTTASLSGLGSSSNESEPETCEDHDCHVDDMELVTEDENHRPPAGRERPAAWRRPVVPAAALVEMLRASGIDSSLLFFAVLTRGPLRPLCLCLVAAWLARGALLLRCIATVRHRRSRRSVFGRAGIPSPAAMRIVRRGGGAGTAWMLVAVRTVLMSWCVELLLQDFEFRALRLKFAALNSVANWQTAMSSLFPQWMSRDSMYSSA